MDGLYSLSPRELAVLSTVLAIEFTAGKTIPEQNVVGNFFAALGESILLISSQQDYIEDKFNNESE